MLELLATCYLVAQTLFMVPDGWRVERVYNGGVAESRVTFSITATTYCSPECEAQRRKSFVVLRKTVFPGETVKAIDQCTMEFTVGGKP